ncbi:ABC transporter ATP-binding protein [Lysobacter silvisoli]|uniref:ATP-binding cassette domain-containing protein n=1 Tax=Lysobacter silvisoli TaxID=2293254 RepID=A0A371JXF2_9GAMM|nr:ABC transporter ATP-binding protein [Lysobacter silvisoli]RDZ26292.1 ATP-binding cassette domain-containing protein [Lysobacter silvisoli]
MQADSQAPEAAAAVHDTRKQGSAKQVPAQRAADSARAAREPTLRVQGLGKRVSLPDGELSILEDVSFQIGRGDTIAIVGASGSGKSTLLSLMAGLDTPSGGSVALDGEVLSTLDEDGRARVRGEKVGFVFQSFQLLPSLTALENVMLPLELRGDREVEAPARAILEQVGLGQRLGHYPRQLSGGEQQRVALARAFVTQPALLFADEPTGNLDTHTGQAIVELLFELNAGAGTTLVLVTHDEHLAARCGRQLRLDSGRLVA